MVLGIPEIVTGVRSERSHTGTWSLANFTGKVFPETSSLVPLCLIQRRERSPGIMRGYLCGEERQTAWKGTRGTVWGAGIICTLSECGYTGVRTRDNLLSCTHNIREFYAFYCLHVIPQKLKNKKNKKKTAVFESRGAKKNCKK